MCFDFTAETSKASTLWGLPDSTVPPPPTDYKAASCLFVSNYRKHRCALFGKAQALTSPTVVKSPGGLVWPAQHQFAQLKAEGLTPTRGNRCFHEALCSISILAMAKQETPDLWQPPSPAPRGGFVVCTDHQPNAPTPVTKNGGQEGGQVTGWAYQASSGGTAMKQQSR